MVRINYTDKGGVFSLTAKGHANTAEQGKDIVCAAVSALVYTLAESIENLAAAGLLKEKEKIFLKSGDAGVTSVPKNQYYGLIWYTYAVILKGLRLIAEAHPDSVSIVTSSTTESTAGTDKESLT